MHLFDLECYMKSSSGVFEPIFPLCMECIRRNLHLQKDSALVEITDTLSVQDNASDANLLFLSVIVSLRSRNPSKKRICMKEKSESHQKGSPFAAWRIIERSAKFRATEKDSFRSFFLYLRALKAESETKGSNSL